MGNLLVIVIVVYVVSQIYFNIDSKIVNKKRYDEGLKRHNEERAEDLAISDKTITYEKEVEVLTVRMGELATDLRNWQIGYNDLKVKYDAKEAEVDEWIKQSEEYKQKLEALEAKYSKENEIKKEKDEVKEPKKKTKKIEKVTDNTNID